MLLHTYNAFSNCIILFTTLRARGYWCWISVLFWHFCAIIALILVLLHTFWYYCTLFLYYCTLFRYYSTLFRYYSTLFLLLLHTFLLLLHNFWMLLHSFCIIAQFVNCEILTVVSQTLNKYPCLHWSSIL